jgi:geranylgeranyl reductase
MLQTKVLVVGAGPAGAVAAKLLMAHGLDCLVVESRPGWAKPCAGATPLATLREFALPRALASSEARTLRLHPPRSEPFDIPLPEPVVLLDRAALAGHLQASLGEALLRGSFLRLLRAGRGRTVAEIALPEGRRVQVAAQYVIGADGVGSRVRAALGLRPLRSHPTLSGPVKTEHGACELYLSPLAPGGYLWVFPTSAGVGARRGLLEALQWLKARRGLRPQDPKGYRVPLWEGPPVVKDNVLLVGDAAGLVMPLSFEGIYYAMLSGQMAAEAVLRGKVSLYPRWWQGRLLGRFRLMRLLQERFLQGVQGMERLLGAFRQQKVQEAALRLYLQKELGRGSLLRFLYGLRRLLH